MAKSKENHLHTYINLRLSVHKVFGLITSYSIVICKGETTYRFITPKIGYNSLRIEIKLIAQR